MRKTFEYEVRGRLSGLPISGEVLAKGEVVAGWPAKAIELAEHESYMAVHGPSGFLRQDAMLRDVNVYVNVKGQPFTVGMAEYVKWAIGQHPPKAGRRVVWTFNQGVVYDSDLDRVAI